MNQILAETKILWRSYALIWVLTRREIAARNAGTAAGTLWAYAQPLLMVGAYYLVFDVVFSMRLSDTAPVKAVGAFLIVGSLPWMAFSDAVMRGMNSLIEAGSTLQKNPLPTVLFPARAVLASGVIFGPLIALMTLIYAPYHHFSLALICLIPLMISQLVLSFLMAYLLAIFAAALRDTVQIVSFMLSIGIYMSPILFPTTMFPADWRWVLWINPMTPIASAYQTLLLQGQWPGGEVVLALTAWIALLAVLLNVVIKRSRDVLVDWL